jgi:dTDP-4-dehydrorhamnose 3,5-epimerase
MLISETGLPGVMLIRPLRHCDARGCFAEIFREDIFARHGIGVHFVQENYSRSESANVIRGLHFQIPPFAQAKLIRVTSGAMSMSLSIYAGAHPIMGDIRQRC